MIKIAIQKSGRLADKSREILASCGIKIRRGGKLKAPAINFPLELLYLRDDDIPRYVSTGVADLGIVGENVLLEHAPETQVQLRLGFGQCRLSLAVPQGTAYTGLDWWKGKRVACSYPNLLRSYFSESGIDASVNYLSGSVEIAPSIGLADGICDIVSTGSTLQLNGLKEVQKILRSEAVLISSPDLSTDQQELRDKLVYRLESVLYAKRNKYILLNAPNRALDKIQAILPGMRSPTVMPLATEGWSSVHSVIPEDSFWEIIDELRAEGAEGILICPIEKMLL